MLDSQPTVAWPPTTVAWPFSDFFRKNFKLLETSKKRCLTVGRWSRDLRPLSRDRSVTFFKKLSKCLKRPKNVVWQSADGRVTSDNCRVTIQWLFSKIFLNAWNVQKTLFDSHPTVAWPPTTVAWPLVTFFKIFPNCLKRQKNVVWQSYNGRVTSGHCRVTFNDFFQNFSELLETSKNVVWQSYNGRVTSDHCRVTFSDFFQNFSELLETSKNVVWQSSNGRVNSDHCRVTALRLFSKIFWIVWNVEKTLSDSRPTVAWPPTIVAWPFSDFFQNFSESLETSKKLFDSHPTVAWAPTTVAWPFSDFFQKFSELLETSKKRCSAVSQRSRDLRPLSRDRSATFFKLFTKCLERRKNVVWQSADSRVASDHCRVTVQRLFSKFFRFALNVEKTLFYSRPTVAWPPTTVAWPFSDFFSKFFWIVWNVEKTLFDSQPTFEWPPTTAAWPFSDFFRNSSEMLETSKNVVWQSANGRVTSDHCRVTVQRLFSKFFWIVRNIEKTLFHSRPTVAWPPTTVAWPFSDFFQNFSDLLKTSRKRCLTVGQRSRDLRPLSRDRSATFFSKNFWIVWNVEKTIFYSRPTVAWPPTTLAWPFSDFFKNFAILVESSRDRPANLFPWILRTTSHMLAGICLSRSFSYSYSSYYSFFPPNS